MDDFRSPGSKEGPPSPPVVAQVPAVLGPLPGSCSRFPPSSHLRQLRGGGQRDGTGRRELARPRASGHRRGSANSGCRHLVGLVVLLRP